VASCPGGGSRPERPAYRQPIPESKSSSGNSRPFRTYRRRMSRIALSDGVSDGSSARSPAGAPARVISWTICNGWTRNP